MSRFIRTFKARKTYLDVIACGGSDTLAAEAAGGNLGIFRRWRETDDDFKADYEDAKEAGTDLLEDAVYNRALRTSDSLAMFMLKARRPDKYDRGSKLELSGGISVEGAKSKLLNKIARLQAAGELSGGGDQALPEENALEEKGTKFLPPPDPDGAPIRGRKRRASTEGSRRAQAS